MRRTLLFLCWTLASLPLAVQASEITLAWDAPAAQPGVTITGYQLQSCLAPAGSTTCQPLDSAGTTLPVTPRTFTYTNLTAGKSYCFTSVSVGTGAQTPRSVPSAPAVCAVAPDDRLQAPSPPQNLRATVP